MKTGTKSILFGVHQFIIHPITVYIAWVWIYKSFPNWKETICIIIHDWGYWGKENMDDENGERHPELAAKIAHWLFDRSGKTWAPKDPYKYRNLCLYHSRHYARNANVEPSRLCWADKLSILFEKSWTYIPRAWASGELAEYRRIASATKFIPECSSNREWFLWIQKRLVTLGQEKRGDVVPYCNPVREKING